MGMKSPAAEAMIDRLLTSGSQEDFVAAVKALDRILTTGRYVIPIWYLRTPVLPMRRQLHYPDTPADVW